MKIIVVYSFAIHPGVHKLAATLSRNGHEVKLLVWDRDKNLPKVEKIDSFTVHRFRLRAPYGKLSVLLYQPFWWLYEFYFFMKEKPHAVHAVNLDTLPPAIMAKLVRGTRLFYTIEDLYGGSYAGPVPSVLRKMVTFFEKVGIAFTDTLFLATEAVYDELKGIRIKKVVYIYNAPEEYPDIEVTHKTTSGTRIFYGGWIARARGIQDMIDAISTLDGVKLVMAGKELDEGVVAYGTAKLKGFQFLGWITHKEIIKQSLEADILFIFADPSFLINFRYATPNKLFEAMMCAKPIIVNDGTPMSRIVRNEDCGIVVPYGDVNAIREAVLKLKNDPELRQRLGQNGRRAYETRYSWKIMESRLVEAYQDLAKK
jgi:glycosyltransferase involved in cell wall biosynthesis